jgi:hypothetical protein
MNARCDRSPIARGLDVMKIPWMVEKLTGSCWRNAGALVACWLVACASDQPAAQSMTPTAPIANATPSGAAAGVTPGAAAGETAMQPGAAPPAAAPMTPAPAATVPDKNRPPAGPGKAADDPAYCAQRRVSYSKPCSDDPDPCGIHTGMDGDAYCQPAPAAGEGFQIHIGPKDYNDPAEIAKYVIEPGSEFNNSVLAHIPLTETRFYNRVKVQMRPGSHHWLSTVLGGQPEERFYEGEDGCYAVADEYFGTIGGGQTLIYDNPPGGVVAPENQGLGGSLPANASVCMNLHAYNYMETPRLREMWINIYFVDAAKVTQPTEPISVIAGVNLSVPPGAKQELAYEQEFAAPGRIIQLWGHRHAWTPRFAAWLNDELIYDSWDWRESVVFNYDSVTTNPAPNPAAMLDGATSGPLKVKEGDKLKFSCFIENGSDQTLTWRNDLYRGEMCNLWGTSVGEGTGLDDHLQ